MQAAPSVACADRRWQKSSQLTTISLKQAGSQDHQFIEFRSGQVRFGHVRVRGIFADPDLLDLPGRPTPLPDRILVLTLARDLLTQGVSFSA